MQDKLVLFWLAVTAQLLSLFVFFLRAGYYKYCTYFWMSNSFLLYEKPGDEKSKAWFI